MVVALHPDMTSIMGEKGLLVLGREFPAEATHRERAELVEGDWDLGKVWAQNSQMKKGA